MVTAFTKEEARGLMDRVIEALKPLGADLDVSFSSGGGRFDGSRFTLKVVANKLDVDGAVTSDSRTDAGARDAFERAGVNVKGKVIGSIWKRADGTLAQVMNYHRSRKKYPIEIRTLTNEEHLLAPFGWFAAATQVTSLSLDDFYFWCRVDPDLLSDKDAERFSTVNGWLTLYVPEKQQDSFFTAISRVIESRVTRKAAEALYNVITDDSLTWDQKINLMEK